MPIRKCALLSLPRPERERGLRSAYHRRRANRAQVPIVAVIALLVASNAAGAIWPQPRRIPRQMATGHSSARRPSFLQPVFELDDIASPRTLGRFLFDKDPIAGFHEPLHFVRGQKSFDDHFSVSATGRRLKQPQRPSRRTVRHARRCVARSTPTG